jgi:hypothetical protein
LSTDVSEVRAASIIAPIMEAARTSETSVNNYFTRQYIQEDKSELYDNLIGEPGTWNTENEREDITENEYVNWTEVAHDWV